MLLIGEFGSQLLLNDSRFNSVHFSAVIPDLHKGNRSYLREISVTELLFEKEKNIEPLSLEAVFFWPFAVESI